MSWLRRSAAFDSEPTTAQGSDKDDGAEHPLTADLRGDAFVGQKRRLRNQHVEVPDKAGLVAVRRDLHRALGVCNRVGFRLGFARQNSERGELVLDFLIR